MKLLPLFLLICFLGQVDATTHPDSIYTYVYDVEKDRAELQAKTTYLTDQNDHSVSILNFKRLDDFSPLELKKIKTYFYHETYEDKMDKVYEYEVRGSDKTLYKSVEYQYNDQGFREAIAISTRRGNEAMKIQTLLKSLDFDNKGRTTKRELYGLDQNKSLSKRQTTLNDYIYDEQGNIVSSNVWSYTLEDELKSSTQKTYTYDHENRILKVVTTDNLTKKIRDELHYTYSEGLKVKEYYVYKNEALRLSWVDSTFFDTNDRISLQKKYQIDQEGYPVLNKYFVHFYSDKDDAVEPKSTQLASVKVKDFNNQSGEISISYLNSDEMYTLSVYDALGRLVAEERIVNQESHRLLIENMTGVLIATLRNQSREIQSQKFILK